jgi:1-acyl-sn-glycerol-3-phosphate acyltransferase
MRWIITTILTYLYGIVGTTIAAASAMIVALLGDTSGRFWWPISRYWSYGLMKAAGITKIHTEGIENILESSSGGVLMSNHESHLDPPTFIFLSKNYPLRFLVKHTLFYFPIFGQSLWAMGHIYINRSNRSNAFQSLEKAAQSIADGKRIYVFPEGTRSRDGKLQKFKKGGFHLAIKAKVPIFPAAIAGTNEILPPGWINHGAGPIVVLFGKPIPTEQYTLDDRDKLINKVYNEISQLKKRANKIRKELAFEERIKKASSIV